MNIEKLAERILQKRAGKGVRLAANDVGISPATLSRIENGKIPDLETFSKICSWLGDDPAIYLGVAPASENPTLAQVHFKKEAAIKKESAKALSEMIMLAHQSLLDEEEIKESN